MAQVKIAYITTIDMSLHYLLLNQLLDLQKEGFEVFGISTYGEHVPVIESNGIHHITVPISRNFSPLADLLSLLRLYRVLRRERFSLVHTHTPKPGLIGQLAARLAFVPVVFNTIHGYYFHENTPRFQRLFYKSIEKFAARLSSLVFFVNQEDMEIAKSEKICSDDKMKLLGPGGIGIDISRLNRESVSSACIEKIRNTLDIQKDTPVVGFVGRLVQEKGVLELLQAARIVHNSIPEVHFLIIGPIDEEKSDAVSPEMAEQYGVSEFCIFTGVRHDIPNLMALMNVLVLPSHREGFPVVPMEASAMGIPCVVTDIRGCREAVEHNRNGLLVPLGNVEALAAAIEKLLCDKKLAQRMGSEGRKMAEKRFNEQIVFANVKNEYGRFLEKKGIKASTS
ncbi:MAG: glycosyltransferase family 4 protein [Candidatus Promineifilaceae bacterium]|nr:glycosyltransferase family 4 protein [Candidatus Promineifilaceae bacterium]